VPLSPQQTFNSQDGQHLSATNGTNSHTKITATTAAMMTVTTVPPGVYQKKSSESFKLGTGTGTGSAGQESSPTGGFV
jgi:hypothetical protein